MKFLWVISITCCSLFFGGCGVSWFVNPKEQPIIEDKLGETGFRTLSMTPERRSVIFGMDSTGNKFFCAEPPSDAAENLANSFAAALKGSDGKLDLSAEFAKTFASNAKQLFFRSQGVQLYRDGMYSLCQSFVIGAISASELSIKQDQLLQNVTNLINAEIPFLPYLKPDDTETPTPPPPPKLGGAAEKAEPVKPTDSDS